jgi:4-hydroxythreonine-4-phosphate dehydrogenase
MSRLEKKRKSPKPVAVLGLNPHAGDSGLIGDEEDLVIRPAIAALSNPTKSESPEPARAVAIEGPLVPDAAFTQTNWSRYSLFLAQYHDQGLIPFKTIHGQSGVHVTWGLPFIRTSVDHGTAFDIAGEDKADPASMRLAIEWAIKLARAQRSGEEGLK